ncbi:MAG: sigma-70 family RNA polymerase sigma factor [Dehalococcoidia bacterium]|nr:sigma-70 family RNA polymerase sigma factor [Dehalococcoidia bacterium]
MDTDADADLIARSRTGDLSAFNLLVERYQTALYSLCLRMLGSQQAAEDAAQEAFISACRSLGSFRGGAFRAWLFRIAANACYDELRRRRARPAVSLDEPRGDDERAHDAPAAGVTMEEHMERLELAGVLREALGSLPPDQRLVIVLCDVQGLDYAEIAAVTGSSLGTVKSRISRGRHRLRLLLLARRELLPSRFRPSSEEA